MAPDKTNASGSEPMTLDKLAEIIVKTVAKKEDLEQLAVRVDSLDRKVDGIDDRMDGVENKIDALEQTMKENFRLVREEIKMLNFAVEIDDLRERMKRVEQKLGIV